MGVVSTGLYSNIRIVKVNMDLQSRFETELKRLFLHEVLTSKIAFKPNFYDLSWQRTNARL